MLWGMIVPAACTTPGRVQQAATKWMPSHHSMTRVAMRQCQDLLCGTTLLVKRNSQMCVARLSQCYLCILVCHTTEWYCMQARTPLVPFGYEWHCMHAALWLPAGCRIHAQGRGLQVLLFCQYQGLQSGSGACQ